MKILVLAVAMLVMGTQAWAGKNFDYKSGGAAMEGYVAEPTDKATKHPAILVVHDWMGVSDHTRAKVDELAKMGYVAFAADIYGKGVRAKDAKEAGALATKYKSDVKLLRERVTSALEALKKQPGVDASKIVAIGYCFGGTTVIELARTGVPLAGVATFHGGLTSDPASAKNIKTKILVMHGAIDPYVPEKDVLAFQKELNEAGVDYQFISYSGAVHAFTIPGAGKDPKVGAAYNASADHRSWAAFNQFLSEVAPR